MGAPTEPAGEEARDGVDAVRRPRTGGRLTLLIKPAGDACDLACRYCFYRGHGPRAPEAPGRMPPRVLERLIDQALRPGGAATVEFAWQGGEPLLMGPAFYRRAFELQGRLRPRGVDVVNTIQTNGRRVDAEYCELFADEKVLVGLSVDGPAAIHDAMRSDREGFGSHAGVVCAAALLRDAGVEVNALVAVHAGNQDRPRDVYRFVVDELGIRHLQLIPVALRDGEALDPLAVDPVRFGEFLVEVLDEWSQRDVGQVFVQQIESVAARLLGAPGGSCAWGSTCGLEPVVERNGDVYSCDHFVDDAHRLGNLLESPLLALLRGARQREFGLAKSERLPFACRRCPDLGLCGGGCPKDRPATVAPAGVPAPRPNVLCAGYRRFFGAARSKLAGLQAAAADPVPPPPAPETS